MRADEQTALEAAGFVLVGIWRFLSGSGARQERKEIRDLLTSVDDRFSDLNKSVGGLHDETRSMRVEVEGVREELRDTRGQINDHIARDERIADDQLRTNRDMSRQLAQLAHKMDSNSVVLKSIDERNDKIDERNDTSAKS